jgi:hypothetical protein
MVGSPDAIGRLIANEVLMLGDRELFQKRDQPGQPPEEQATQTNAAPISHNDRAMASVLMTLIDEQIDASAAAPKDLMNDPAAAQARAERSASIAARYADTEAAYQADPPPQPLANALQQADLNVLRAASSPELRMAMQAAMTSAYARMGIELATAGGEETRTRVLGPFAKPVPILRIGAGIAVAIFVVVLVAAHFAG